MVVLLLNLLMATHLLTDKEYHYVCMQSGVHRGNVKAADATIQLVYIQWCQYVLCKLMYNLYRLCSLHSLKVATREISTILCLKL